MAGIGSRKQIQIIQLTRSEDGNGYAKTSQTLYTGWAGVSQVSGFREFQNGQAQMGTVKEFKIRHPQAIPFDVNTRLVYHGKQYTVTSIERDREKRFYWIVRAASKDHD